MPESDPSLPRRPHGVRPAHVFACLALLCVVAQSRVALLLWLMDGTAAAIALLAATLSGHGLLSLFRLGPMPGRWRWMAAAGLGIGALTLVMLGLGAAGLIGPHHRALPMVLLAIGAVVGLVTLVRRPGDDGVPPAAGERTRLDWLIVALAPCAALVALVAMAPPGVLWAEEGRGYDVLEYHLETPREYYEAGAITYLPHNVYGNFPAAAEMLFLTSMHIGGDAIESWSTAKCMNAMLGALFVAAVWLAAREVGPRSAIVTAVVTGSAGWVVYLSGVAYVENGLLFFGALAAACVLRAASTSEDRLARRWLLLAGVAAGLSCGFKYTGVPLIVAPLAILWLVMSARVRWSGVVVYGIAALVAFAPWLIKNAVMTGNPVFPLAGTVFDHYPTGWGADQAEHFAESHAPTGEEAKLDGRARLAWGHSVADPAQRFGAILFALAFVALLRRRGRIELALAATLALQLAVWMFATHLYARFAVPMLIPLALLAGRGALDRTGRVSTGFVVLIVAGVAFNLYKAGQLYAEHIYPDGQRIDIEGRTAIFTGGYAAPYRHLATINTELPADAKILMLGDARAFYFQRAVEYCVVFNRNPFAEVVDESAELDNVMTWLQHQGYTHVFVNWSEIARLRASRYGFPEAITPSLFAQLQDHGLQVVEEFRLTDRSAPYGTLYAVPRGKAD